MDAAAELIVQRCPVHRRDFVRRLRARFLELPWDTGNVRGDDSDVTFGRPHRTLLPLGRGYVLNVQLHVVEIATTPRPPRNTKCRRRWPSPSRHADVAA